MPKKYFAIKLQCKCILKIKIVGVDISPRGAGDYFPVADERIRGFKEKCSSVDFDPKKNQAKTLSQLLNSGLVICCVSRLNIEQGRCRAVPSAVELDGKIRCLKRKNGIRIG